MLNSLEASPDFLELLVWTSMLYWTQVYRKAHTAVQVPSQVLTPLRFLAVCFSKKGNCHRVQVN